MVCYTSSHSCSHRAKQSPYILLYPVNTEGYTLLSKKHFSCTKAFRESDSITAGAIERTKSGHAGNYMSTFVN